MWVRDQSAKIDTILIDGAEAEWRMLVHEMFGALSPGWKNHTGIQYHPPECLQVHRDISRIILSPLTSLGWHKWWLNEQGAGMLCSRASSGMSAEPLNLCEQGAGMPSSHASSGLSAEPVNLYWGPELGRFGREKWKVVIEYICVLAL